MRETFASHGSRLSKDAPVRGIPASFWINAGILAFYTAAGLAWPVFLPGYNTRPKVIFTSDYTVDGIDDSFLRKGRAVFFQKPYTHVRHSPEPASGFLGGWGKGYAAEGVAGWGGCERRERGSRSRVRDANHVVCARLARSGIKDWIGAAEVGCQLPDLFRGA